MAGNRILRKVAGDLEVAGTIKALGVNTPDMSKVVTELASTKEDVREVTVDVQDAIAAAAAAQTAAAAAQTAANSPILSLSSSSATRNRAGTLSPVSLTVSSAKRDGTAYAGRFVIDVSADGSTWIGSYPSEEDESSHAYTIPATVTIGGTAYFVASVRVRLYEAGGAGTTLYGQQYVVINASTDTAPIYWGSVTTLPTSGMLVNDYLFDARTPAYNASTAPDGGGIIRYWTGSAWAEMTSAHNLFKQAAWAALADMAEWATAQDTVVAAAEGLFQKIFSSSAFVAYAFINQIDVPDGGRIRYFNGKGVQKRCVQLAKDCIDFLDTPDTSPASAELLRARIGRLGVGPTILIDGDFEANIGMPWGSESIINSSNSANPNCIQMSNGNLRVAYCRVSDGYLVERIRSDSSWGSESVINAIGYASPRPNYIQLASGELRIAYIRATDHYLVERVWSGTAWGSESVINASESAYCDYVQLANGELRIAYRNVSGDNIVERIWSGSAWGAESAIGAVGCADPDYIQLASGELRISYIRITGGYLIERIWNGTAWGTESVINAGITTDSNYVQLINGELRIAYCRATDYCLVERVWSGTAWGSESTINSDVTYDPNYIQLSNGELHILYKKGSNNYLVERVLGRYARVGSGIVEVGASSSTEAVYIKFGCGIAICYYQSSTAVTCNSVDGSVYYATTPLTFPITFIATPKVINMGKYNTGGTFPVNPRNVTVSGYSAMIASGRTGATGYPGYVVIGAWK